MTEVEFTDRYQALGIIPNGCKGQCEGTGWVPVFIAEGDQLRGGGDVCRPSRSEIDPHLRLAWQEAEVVEPSPDGWHFVVCLDCHGRVALADLEAKP